jgi:hypothetical protein
VRRSARGGLVAVASLPVNGANLFPTSTVYEAHYTNIESISWFLHILGLRSYSAITGSELRLSHIMPADSMVHDSAVGESIPAITNHVRRPVIITTSPIDHFHRQSVFPFRPGKQILHTRKARRGFSPR